MICILIYSVVSHRLATIDSSAFTNSDPASYSYMICVGDAEYVLGGLLSLRQSIKDQRETSVTK